MKTVRFSALRGKSLTLSLNTWAKVALSLCVLGVPFGAGLVVGVKSSLGDLSLRNALAALQAELDLQRQVEELTETETKRKMEVYSRKLAEIQARAVRMDAFGEHIIDVIGLDMGEFDFSRSPGLGGPSDQDIASLGIASLDGKANPIESPVESESVELESAELEGAELENVEAIDSHSLIQNKLESLQGFSAGAIAQDTSVALQTFFTQIESHMDDREQQFSLLSDMLADSDLRRESTITGSPIVKGWLSSRYGERIDPFNGRVTWHKGLDFTGRKDSEIVAVAAGIVLRSGRYRGYGRMVEIDHGDGFITRYGHNKSNLVVPGDLVKKGETLAIMGSSGRSTGPHVHFEVYKNGRNVDPASYIRRTIR